MTEPKKQLHTDAEFDGIMLEIQRLEVDIINATTTLAVMKDRIAKLRQERDEMRGGQALFMLGEQPNE